MFKCQSCGQIFVIERLAKLHGVKNMDVVFNLTYFGRDFSSESELSGERFCRISFQGDQL